MINNSRIDIYDFLYGILSQGVTKNVYKMSEPQELSESDTKDGFIVIRVGDMNDESEFSGNAYGWARVYVETYVPPKSRGRLDRDKYKEYENKINALIGLYNTTTMNGYSILEESVMSMDYANTSNANNAYYIFVKSFIVTFDNNE